MDVFPALTALLNWRAWRLPFSADAAAFWLQHADRPYLTETGRMIWERQGKWIYKHPDEGKV
jgi:hypothetical protein